ncbi:hypothetical protein FB6_3431 [Serratia marcescens]|nr:hypothetical protein FB6_3431 [Serratia marcescens]
MVPDRIVTQAPGAPVDTRAQIEVIVIVVLPFAVAHLVIGAAEVVIDQQRRYAGVPFIRGNVVTRIQAQCRLRDAQIQPQLIEQEYRRGLWNGLCQVDAAIPGHHRRKHGHPHAQFRQFFRAETRLQRLLPVGSRHKPKLDVKAVDLFAVKVKIGPVVPGRLAAVLLKHREIGAAQRRIINFQQRRVEIIARMSRADRAQQRHLARYQAGQNRSHPW